VIDWIRARDPGYSALRRAGRGAIVMPGIFAITDKVIANPTIALFSAFAALSTLLFADFRGSMRERVEAQASLVVGGMALVTLGTLCSQTTWLAVLAAFVVAFVVLFAGIVSSVLASASTAALVGFVLAVTTPGAASTLPDRLAGWGISGAASLFAIALLWPAPTREPLRAEAARACALLARRLHAEVDCVVAGFGADLVAARAAITSDAHDAVSALRRAFFATPYRPTGLMTSTRTLVRLVDEVAWLSAVLDRMPVGAHAAPADAEVCDVKRAAATLLERGGELLAGDDDASDPARLEPDLAQLREARAVMERTVTAMLPSSRDGAPEFVSSLEPSFRAHEMSFVVSAIATNIEQTVAARRRTWWQRLLGRQPEGVGSPLASAWERLRSHLEPSSVWLHNSLRGATGLGLAVLVAELTGVQHSFWVAFGALSVLRTNASATGQNALRALLGTIAGFVVGGALIYAIGSNPTVFWILLPFAVLFTGFAPAAISFAAGQAGFTMTLLILYNVIGPAGWQIGLVRIEDVVIGCAVSLAVGVLFWPRGSASAFGQALADGLADSAAYLRGAVEYGVTRCDRLSAAVDAPREASRRASEAARRLDDAFRSFLAERGTKHLPLADVTQLLSAVLVLRITADAILDLWGDGGPPEGDRAAARMELVAVGGEVADWYAATARAISGAGGDVPAPLGEDPDAEGRLVETVRRDLGGADGAGTSAAVKVIWTADHLEAARLLQPVVAGPAGAAAMVQHTPVAWLGTLRSRFPLAPGSSGSGSDGPTPVRPSAGA